MSTRGVESELLGDSDDTGACSSVFQAQSQQAKNKVQLNCSFRDGIQSNFGTNISAEEMIQMFIKILDAGYDSAQVAGGTFMALFVDKGRDAWLENEKLLNAFKEMATTALTRGDCLVRYDRTEYALIKFFMEEMKRFGLRKIENFHGNNDERFQEATFRAARELGIEAPKTVCIEDNPNITIHGIMQALEAQRDMAPTPGIYIKNASGKVEPRLVYDLVKAAHAKYPGEPIRVHTHDNHGMGLAVYMAAVEAAAEVGASIELDTLPRPVSGGTAQPAAEDVAELIVTHTNSKVRAMAPNYKPEMDAKGYDAQYTKMFQYRGKYLRYSKEKFDAAFECGMAGGAMTAIKDMGILEPVRIALKLDYVEDAFVPLCKMESRVKAAFGYPTSVTPFQKMLSTQASISIQNEARGLGFYEMLWDHNEAFSGSLDFLTGKLSRVSPLASSAVIDVAFKKRGVTDFVPFIKAEDLPSQMPAAREALAENGIEDPSEQDVFIAAMYGDKGVARVTEKHTDTMTPQAQPAWPEYLNADSIWATSKPAVNPYHIAKAMGGAPALERFAQAVLQVEKHADGFYKTTVGMMGVYNRTRDGQKELDETSFFTNGIHVAAKQKEFAARAEDYIENFVATIPQKLRDYGMSEEDVQAAMVKHVPVILEDVAEGKARGSYKRSVPALRYDDEMQIHLKNQWAQTPKKPLPSKKRPNDGSWMSGLTVASVG